MELFLKLTGLFWKRIRNLFRVIVSADDTTNPKPHPEHVELALKALNVKPSEAIMIGDSSYDIESGKSAGTKTIRVTYGIHKEEMDNPKPDYFVDDISDILKIL